MCDKKRSLKVKVSVNTTETRQIIVFVRVSWERWKPKQDLIEKPGTKNINVFRACLGAQLTICAQK